MASASITITDDGSTGQVTVSADFGDKLDETSQAHAMIYQLLSGVLGAAKTYQAVEDTAGDLDGKPAEPSKILIV
jgi:hypothetical protein